MEVVHELIYLLDRYSVRHIDVITNPRTAPDKKESRYHDYYIGMRENRWADEAAAAEAFGMEPDSKNWQRFKNEVKKRIANSLLFIEGDEQSLDEHAKAHINAIQLWSVAKTCWLRGGKISFFELAYKALDIAVKYELLDIMVDISQRLKYSLVNDMNKRKEYIRVNTIYEESIYLFNQELLAKKAYEDTMLSVINKKGFRQKFINISLENISKIKEYSDSNQTISFQNIYRNLEINLHLFKHEWHTAYKKAKSAVEFFQSKPFIHKNFIISFTKLEAVCLIILGQHEAAKKAIEASTQFNIEGSYNWFKAHELQTINSLYSQNYREAWDTYKLVTKHKLYNINVTPLDKETWRLFHAYLILLIRTNKLDVSPREKGDADKFRINSWLNDVGTLSLDKQGSNIPVLIFHTVFLLVEDRYDEYLNRMEALRKYKQRNLDPENEHYRTDCFIRLLDLFGENHSPKELLQHAAPLLKGLTSVSTDLLDSSFELEVMPYEHQWEWLLEVYTSRNKG